MGKQFQAKDIQKMLDIPKHRYEYLATKIGIDPDIATGEGRGSANLYSFRNAMQFAIAHRLNEMGLGPGKIRSTLKFIDLKVADKEHSTSDILFEHDLYPANTKLPEVIECRSILNELFNAKSTEGYRIDLYITLKDGEYSTGIFVGEKAPGTSGQLAISTVLRQFIYPLEFVAAPFSKKAFRTIIDSVHPDFPLIHKLEQSDSYLVLRLLPIKEIVQGYASE